MRTSIVFSLYLICFACSNGRTNTDKEQKVVEPIESKSETQPDSIISKPAKDLKQIAKGTEYDSLLELADTSEINFHFNFIGSKNRSVDFFSGYFEYDEEYDFYPAYLKVFADKNLILEDSFEAYSEIRVEPKGKFQFSSDLDFFGLKYGLEAHDYITAERLIFVSKNTCQVIDEFTSQWTDYATRYTDYVFPSDSGGVANTLITIDKIDYTSGEEPNIRDTTIYNFENLKFKKEVANNR